ncbi:MAG: hypothetical protein R3261_14070, partial [Alphaproteobacteria bacterium]|nr:hypothetical protein [Alphaproteobacteria bacterium]
MAFLKYIYQVFVMYVSSSASNLYDLLNNISNEYRRNDRINSKEVDASEQVSKGGDVEARNAYSVGEAKAIDPNDAKFANAISADDQGGAKTLFLAT